MSERFDALVIGAGYAGAVTARELAERGGKRVLVLERRDHIGGNAYDRPDDAGVLIHRYGPHIFHTNRTGGCLTGCPGSPGGGDYQHRVIANLPRDDPRGSGTGSSRSSRSPSTWTSLENGLRRPRRASAWGISSWPPIGAEKKVTILELRQNADPRGRRPRGLCVRARLRPLHHEAVGPEAGGDRPRHHRPGAGVPVPGRPLFSGYLPGDAPGGLLPPCFEPMLDHPNITVELGVDASGPGGRSPTRHVTLDGAVFTGPVIYTGQADELFGFRFGPLPYRTLDFRLRDADAGAVLPGVRHGELHGGRGLYPHHRVQTPDRPGGARQDHHREGVFPGLYRRQRGKSPITPSSTRRTTPCTPGIRRTGRRVSPACTCWAVLRSISTTTWTPSPQPGPGQLSR